MAKSLQILRGTSQQTQAYKGQPGEILMDMDRMVLALVDDGGAIHLTQHGSADLDAVAALTGVGLVERVGDGVFAVVALTDAGKALIAATTLEEQRVILGVSSRDVVAATPVTIQADGGDMGELGSIVAVLRCGTVVGVFPVTGMSILSEGQYIYAAGIGAL